MQPSEDNVSETSTEPNPNRLSLPKIRGACSLDELVTHSRNMSSVSSKSGDDAESSLADSTYEVVDVRNLVSDDELDVQSESLPSCGGNTTDCDVSSVADTEEYVENRASVTSLPPSDYPTPAPSDEEVDVDDFVEESSTTVRPGNLSSSKLIQFPEPTKYDKSGRDAGTALVKQQIAVAYAEDFPADLEHSATSLEVPLGLRMRLAEKPLHAQGPFSVMLIGDISGAREDVLVHKIASALAAGHASKSPNPSAPTRLNIVPMMSSGLSESCPDIAVIEGTGTELVVEKCTMSIKVCDENGRPRLVKARINDEWIDLKTFLDLPIYKLQELPHSPHLAVFIYGNPEKMRSSSENHDWIWHMEELMFERGVPTIHLANQAQWELFRPDPCSDGLLQMTATLGKGTEATSPVELDAFFRLHNGQLGRHLAFLESVRQEVRQRESVLDIFRPRSGSRLTRAKPADRAKMLILSFACMMLFVLFHFVLPPGLLTRPESQVDLVNRTSALNSSLIKLTNCTTAISAPPFSSLLSNTQFSEDASERAAYSRLSEAIANGTEKFEAFPFADHFVAIKAPTGFTRLRDAPTLFVNATRNGRSLEANISKLEFEHYAVVLEEEQSYGQVNLTVFTKTKPLIHQSIVVNLGSFWRHSSTINAMLDAGMAQVRHDAQTLQSSFTNLTNRWIAKIANNTRNAKGTIRPVVTEVTRSTTNVSVAAGAATWKTMKFAQTLAAAELSRACRILANSNPARETLQNSRQFLSNLLNRSLASMVSVSVNVNGNITSFNGGITSVIELLNKTLYAPPRRPSFTQQLAKHLRQFSSRPIGVAKTSLPLGKMRNRAAIVWEKVFRKQPVSKAVGAPLADIGVRKTKSRARGKNGVIHVDSDVVKHRKMKDEAKQTHPRSKTAKVNNRGGSKGN